MDQWYSKRTNKVRIADLKKSGLKLTGLKLNGEKFSHRGPEFLVTFPRLYICCTF